MRTNKERTGNPAESPDRLQAQRPSSRVPPHADKACRTPERPLLPGMQSGLGYGGIRHQDDLGIRGRPRHEEHLFPLQTFQKAAGGQGQILPDEAFGEWEARTGDCRPPALVPPGQGLFVSAANTQAITELALQGAWHRLRQRRQGKPDLLAPWHWLSPRKEWILLVALVEKLKLPQYGWTSVANYWCPHYNMGTWCTTSTHATFIPPEDHRDTEKMVLDSQAEVLKWSTDFPGVEIDREDGSGLEFECQLNTPSLARLHHLRKLGGTNVMALRKTLLDKQDLLRMDAGGFLDEGY